MKIAIVGRKKDTLRYETYFSALPAQIITTLSVGELASCDAVVLPGGGDITPAFFGEHNNGSKNIDVELDILQLQAVEHCLRYHLPLLGICKGMQVINVALGGTITQDLSTAGFHRYLERDQYHTTTIAADSFLATLYGTKMTVNSAHHQGIKQLGRHLRAIQWADYDHCIEAIEHTSLPLIGLQWHPERLDQDHASATGAPLLAYFSSLTEA